MYLTNLVIFSKTAELDEIVAFKRSFNERAEWGSILALLMKGGLHREQSPGEVY